MVVFEGSAPISSTTLNTTVSGSFEISGLIQACKQKASGQYESPLIDERWQVQLSFNDPSYVRLKFVTTHSPNESLDKNGNRKGQYEVTISMRLGLLNQNHTEPYRRYQPTQSSIPANGWSHDYWISRSALVDLKHSDDVSSLSYTITERSDEIPPATINPALTSFPEVAASLFDDEETSNVVFAISDSKRASRHDEFIFGHSKILSIRSEYFKTLFSTTYKDIIGVKSLHESDLGVPDFSDLSECGAEEEDMTDGTLTPDSSLKDVTSTHKRRVIRIQDTSYGTFRAMLYYLYTGLYSFQPLNAAPGSPRPSNVKEYDFKEPFIFTTLDYKSIEKELATPSSLRPSYSESTLMDIPKASAKSIYKLCDRLNMHDLKAHALHHIRTSLTPDNITQELNSAFTSRYPEVRKIENDYLKANWKDIRTTPAFTKFLMRSFADQPEGVADMWLGFFQNL